MIQNIKQIYEKRPQASKIEKDYYEKEFHKLARDANVVLDLKTKLENNEGWNTTDNNDIIRELYQESTIIKTQ